MTAPELKPAVLPDAKPCPFCGSVRIVKGERYFAMCVDCGATGPERNADATQNKFVGDWNTRICDGSGDVASVPEIAGGITRGPSLSIELKPSTDWASEWLGYNVGSEQKRLVEWIDEIKANAAAHAHHKALTEAAEIVLNQGMPENPTKERAFYAYEAITALRDAKET